MKRYLLTSFIVALFALPCAHATPATAERARKAYQLGVERWQLESRLATTQEELQAADRNRPDPIQAAREVWQAIAPELNRPWILPHAAWLIQMADGLGNLTTEDGNASPAFEAEISRVLAAIREFHLKADDATSICIALAGRGSPDRLALLEAIRTGHPKPTTRGVAALAQAMAMKQLGGEPAVIAKRLELLRDAIIHSADEVIQDKTTVAEIASEELYLITHLTKGRTAPDLTGTDSAGRAMKLSDTDGKVRILLFWSANDPAAREVIEFATGLQQRLVGQDIELIGVNTDATATLRPMEADGSITWKNFSDPQRQLAHAYRISATPLCFILDGQRKIQHTGAPGSFIELAATAIASDGDEKPD